MQDQYGSAVQTDSRSKFRTPFVESVSESIRSARKTYHLSKYHILFEKGISTKKQREEGGYFMCILNDVDDFRKFNCTPENSIVLGERLLEREVK